MAMNQHAMRYEIEIDVLERRPERGDREAIAVLRGEFARALNASHFIALSAEDPDVAVVARSFPQEGVTRYAVEFEFIERRVLSEAEALALVHSEFTRAVNASYFNRVVAEDPVVRVLSRDVAAQPVELRRAA